MFARQQIQVEFPQGSRTERFVQLPFSDLAELPRERVDQALAWQLAANLALIEEAGRLGNRRAQDGPLPAEPWRILRRTTTAGGVRFVVEVGIEVARDRLRVHAVMVSQQGGPQRFEPLAALGLA